MSSLALSHFIRSAVLCCAFTLSIPGQTTSNPAPAKPTHAPRPAPSTQRVFSPYWKVSGDTTSEFQLHNNLIDDSLDIAPIVLTEDGDRVTLPSVHIPALGNATVDVGNSLAGVGRSDIRQGSATFEYEYSHRGALLVETTVHDRAATLAYTIIGTEKGAKSSELYGLYWFPNRTSDADVFIAVQNTADTPVNVVAKLEGTDTAFASTTLAPFQSAVLWTDIPKVNAGARSGSVVLLHDAPEDALHTSGWIESKDVGYSNMMTLHDPARATQSKLYGTQVFLGPNASLTASGKQVAVQSRLMLLNTSDAPITPTGIAAFMSGTNVVQSPLVIPELQPGKSTMVDLRNVALPSGAETSGSLVIDYDGPKGAITGRIFGAANDTFGFYGTLETYAAGSYSELYWTTQDDMDSLLTIANFAEEPDDVIVTLTYDGGTAALPTINLQPLQSVTVDVREFRKGGKIPSAAEFGGLQIEGKSRLTSHLAVKEHAISANNQTSAPYYGTGPFVYNYEYDPYSFQLEVGDEQYITGVQYWTDNRIIPSNAILTSSSDYSIADITYYQTTVSAVGVGTATVYGWDQFPADQWQTPGWFPAQTFATDFCTVGIDSADSSKLGTSSGEVTFEITNGSCDGTVRVAFSPIAGPPGSTLDISSWATANPATIALPGHGMHSGTITGVFNTSGAGELSIQIAIEACNGGGCDNWTLSPNPVVSPAVHIP